jgi:hypothetical protein
LLVFAAAAANATIHSRLRKRSSNKEFNDQNLLGRAEAPDAETAIKVAIEQFQIMNPEQ